MAGCNRMAGLSDGFQVRVSISTTEINTQTHKHAPFFCAYTLCAQGLVQKINAHMLILNVKGLRMRIFHLPGILFTYLFEEMQEHFFMVKNINIQTLSEDCLIHSLLPGKNIN